MKTAEQYRIDALHDRIRELERWQEQAREDIARMERCIIALAEPRSTPVDLGEVAAMHGLCHVR